MESNQTLSITANTIHLPQPWANLLQNNTVMLEFMGELMDSGLSIDRNSLSSGNIVVTRGNPEKVSAVIRKIICEIDVPAQGGDEDISTILNSLRKDHPGQLETIFDQDRSTFKLAFHRKIKSDLKPVLQWAAIKSCFLPLSPAEVHYLQRHRDAPQKNANNGEFKSEVNLKMQKDVSGKDRFLISSIWSEFKAVKQFAERLLTSLQIRHEKLETSRALFLSSVEGQKELRQLEEDGRCSISVVLPGHQLLMRAESPKGHCLYLYEGSMAVSDCSVLVLPLLENAKDWTPAQRLILEKALLATKTELYAELIASAPKPRTLTLHSQRPGGGRTIVLAHIPDQPDCGSAVTEGLHEALQLPCARGTSVALPIRMSALHSLAENLKSILPVIQQVLDQEETPNTLVFYLESTSSASDGRSLAKTLQQTLNSHWKIEMDDVALEEAREPVLPEAFLCGQHQDLEKTSSELRNIHVPSEYEARARMLNCVVKPEHGPEQSAPLKTITAERETGAVPGTPGEENRCNFDDKADENDSVGNVSVAADANDNDSKLSGNRSTDDKDVERTNLVDGQDLRHPQQIFSDDPVNCGVLSAHTALQSNTVLVQNLNPKTGDETLLYFFSNEKRSHGGPVSLVTRLDNSRALVCFENYLNAQAVASKGFHVLDGSTLDVSLYLEYFSPATGTTPERQESGAYNCSEKLANRSTPLTSELMRMDLREQQGLHLDRSKKDFRPVGVHLQPYELSHHPNAGRGTSGDHASFASERRSRGRKSTRGFTRAFHAVDGRRQAQSGQHFGDNSFQPQYPPPAYLYTTAGYPHADAVETSFLSTKHNPDGVDRKRRAANPQSSLTQQEVARQMVVRLGLIVFSKLQKDTEILQRFKRELTEIDAIWEWSPPECIVVSATKTEVPEDWQNQVWKTTDRYKHLLQYTFVEEVDKLQRNRELRSGQALSEQRIERDPTPRGENSRTVPPYVQGVDTQNGGQTDDKTPEQEKKVLHVEWIRNLTSGQIKFLSLPHAEIKFEEKYKGLSFHMDRENKKLGLRFMATDNSEAKKMKADVMEYVTQISETRLPATEAMAKLFSDTRSVSCIEAMLRKRGVLCRLELESDCISVTAPTLQLLQRAEEILGSSFKEDSVALNEENLAATKSSRWQTLVEKLCRRAREEMPPPVVLLNTEKMNVTLVDIEDNFSRSLADIKTFFSTKRIGMRTLKIKPNHCKFLRNCCRVYLKQLKEKASEMGVSFEISSSDLVQLRGFCEEMDAIETMIKTFLQNIEVKQKPFSGPGVATYLNSALGQVFLEQTGQANGCLITTYNYTTTCYLPDCGGHAVADIISGRGEDLSHDEDSNVIDKNHPDKEKDSAKPKPCNCGSGSSQKLPTMCKSIALVVYSKETEAIERVMEIVHDHIQKNQATRREEDKIICNFSPQQVSAVMNLQKTCEVTIELDVKEGCVQITGFETDVLGALAAIKDIKSDASKHSSIINMTPVLWQYEVEDDRYKSFDPEAIQDIEAAYNRKEHFVMLIDREGRKYKLVFEEKKEYFLDSNAAPVSVRRIDVSQGNTDGREKTEDNPLPHYWEPMKEAKVKLVDLDPSSNEYKDVLQNFGSQTVRKIQRVQNPSLYQLYMVKKKELEMHNPPGTENEMRLWHGTDSKNIDSIITNGFNRSYCGQHGTAYGQGVYFATDSAYSRRYAKGSQMFKVRVLVGESTRGHSSMKIPPSKPGSSRPYDSLSGPGMFVIFHDTQAYPEYLVTCDRY